MTAILAFTPLQTQEGNEACLGQLGQAKRKRRGIEHFQCQQQKNLSKQKSSVKIVNWFNIICKHSGKYQLKLHTFIYALWIQQFHLMALEVRIVLRVLVGDGHGQRVLMGEGCEQVIQELKIVLQIDLTVIKCRHRLISIELFSPYLYPFLEVISLKGKSYE